MVKEDTLVGYQETFADYIAASKTDEHYAGSY